MERQCRFVFGPVIVSEGAERQGSEPPSVRLNIPVIIIKVDIFIQTPMILPYFARVRIAVAATQVVRDRGSAAAVVVIVTFEGFQRGGTELGAIETIKVGRRGISALSL